MRSADEEHPVHMDQNGDRSGDWTNGLVVVTRGGAID